MEKTEFDLELKMHEVYKLLNERYQHNLTNVESKVDDFFENYKKNIETIKNNTKQMIKNKYIETATNVEESLKNIEESLTKLDKTNQLEVKRIKRRMEDTTQLLENENEIDKQFEQIFIQMTNRLQRLKLTDLLKKEFVFFGLTSGTGRLGWDDNNDPILTVMAGGSSYKCYCSTETFEGEMYCKIRIISINVSNISGYWNYTFGLKRNNTQQNQSSYYNDCVLVQSNGHCSTQFSGSSDTVNRKISPWKEGDFLTVSRDLEGNVYFQSNDEEKVKCYSNITGEMKVVLGFSSALHGEQFEMLDCSHTFE